jgi:rare lipoprotein A
MTRRAFMLALGGTAASACAVRGRLPGLTGSPLQRGLASWYGRGDGYNGRRTANGERFDKNKLTAAHYDLPFGSRVRVRHVKNGRHVDVTINDRLPLETVRSGRIIDLSYRAAEKLAMVDEGVALVELHRL